jgi:glutathione peroxidase
LYALSPVPNIFELSLETVDGETLPLKNYRNKVLVVVNTASKCGFTPQYKDLESLHQRYKDRDVVVLGFPSNDFRNQEPGTDEEIKKFCKLKFGVTFPILRKGPVTGPEMQSFYRILLSSASPEFKEPPAWNFEKIIIGWNGQIVARFGSFVNPLSDRITSVIEREIESTIDKKNP